MFTAAQIEAMPSKTSADLKAKIEALKELVKEAGKVERSTITFKVSEKKALSMYGLGRFPVTLYAGQWRRLLEAVPQIQASLEAHKADLAEKTEPAAV